MRPLEHLVCSVGLASLLYQINGDAKCAVSCVLTGTLVDVDHLIEYRQYCREQSKGWDWKEFSSGTYFDRKGTIKVVFHSWEVVILGIILCFMKRKQANNNREIGMISGYTLHLILDQIGNNMGKKGYFWLYRYFNGWNQKKLLENET